MQTVANTKQQRKVAQSKQAASITRSSFASVVSEDTRHEEQSGSAS